MHFSVLQNDWAPLMQKWQTWTSSLTPESAEAAVAWKDLKGNSFEMPTWQIVLHLVNHGTHHRGQVSGFTLGSYGEGPPPLDLGAVTTAR